MKVSVIVLGLCAACATTVLDYPMDRAPDPAHALVAGLTDFKTVRVYQKGTGAFNLRPSHREFLVALPPGTYVLSKFDHYKPTDDRVTFNVRAGEAIYIGSFLRDQDQDGNLNVVVADKMPDVESALLKRYSAKVPGLTREIARSSVATTGGDFAIKVYRPGTYSGAPGHWGAHRRFHGFLHGGGHHGRASHHGGGGRHH